MTKQELIIKYRQMLIDLMEHNEKVKSNIGNWQMNTCDTSEYFDNNIKIEIYKSVLHDLGGMQ